MTDCARCGAPHASHGLGPPARAEQAWFCGACIGLQPYAQKRLAALAREMVEDPEIIIR